MRRHPTRKLDRFIPWLVEVVDKIYSEDVSRDFDSLCQGMSKNVKTFFPRFQKQTDMLKIFNPQDLRKSRNRSTDVD
jgi:hypothetical protein